MLFLKTARKKSILWFKPQTLQWQCNPHPLDHWAFAQVMNKGKDSNRGLVRGDDRWAAATCLSMTLVFTQNPLICHNPFFVFLMAIEISGTTLFFVFLTAIEISGTILFFIFLAAIEISGTILFFFCLPRGYRNFWHNTFLYLPCGYRNFWHNPFLCLPHG